MVARLIHLIRFVRRFKSYLQRMEDLVTLSGIRISSASTLIFRMFFLFVVLNHWCACVWFAIHRVGVASGRPFTWGMTSDMPIATYTPVNGTDPRLPYDLPRQVQSHHCTNRFHVSLSSF